MTGGISFRRKKTLVGRMFERMHAAFGPLHWWPAETFDELVIGVVLTQNTNWGNVERALARLKEAEALSLAAVLKMRRERLARLIRPAGYFNVKAERLQAVARFFVEERGADPRALRRLEQAQLRQELLGVHGLGPESVDSILLYGLDQSVFVIDAYTLRIGARHGLFPAGTKYAAAQELFERCLASDAAMFNEYHAALVRVGHRYCKPRPACADCPLNRRSLFLDPAAAPESACVNRSV